MSDVIINAKVGVSGVNNGAVVVFAQETGAYNRYDPQINQFLGSGTYFNRYNTRFDEHYNGGAGNYAQTVNTTIASGEATSSTIDTYGRQLAGMWLPSGFTGTGITFLSSPSFDGNFTPINNTDGTIYSVAFSTNYQPVELKLFPGVRYLKIVSSSNQANFRSFPLTLKDI
jgi:hypothetical protein